MFEQTIDSTTDLIKVLNDLNQEAKKIFKKYYIFKDNIIVANNDKCCITSGTHFAYADKSLVDFLDGEDTVIQLDSESIFKYVKEYKKRIVKLLLLNNSIYIQLDDDQKLLIGDVWHYNKIPAEIRELYNRAKYLKNVNDKPDRIVEESIIDLLLGDETIIYNVDEFKVRLRKQIFPGFKKGFEINLNIFKEITENEWFSTLFSVKRNKLTSYHMYNFIQY